MLVLDITKYAAHTVVIVRVDEPTDDQVSEAITLAESETDLRAFDSTPNEDDDTVEVRLS